MADNFSDSLLVLYAEDVLEDGEFLLLVEENKRPAHEFPYWKFPRFSLNDISEDECLAEFRFEKQDISRLARALRTDCHKSLFAQMGPLQMQLRLYACYSEDLHILADTVILSQGLVDLSPKCPTSWER